MKKKEKRRKRRKRRSLSSIDSSLCSRVNLRRFSLAAPSLTTPRPPLGSALAAILYSNATELEITKPSQATCSEARPTS
ncbi:hypothetical protein LSTR_LSTR012446 [Laodelphax striatellus]|uniref:Uncharacterized protein n=1 Tax=Laodelphax striatellus TaxID=195883 RepID=A0A482X3F0_LAOST|nr:hypothetical protein LSTR_LSTR012446 [Laodelphax striatellus]